MLKECKGVSMLKKVFVFLADGFEEVEAITPVDYLRRAGLETVTVSLNANLEVKGSHGISIVADVLLSSILSLDDACAIVFPGGMPGASNLEANVYLDALIKEAVAAGIIIAAICASPAVVLAPKGILKGKNWTCYPTLEGASGYKATWKSDKVVTDGNIITSRGPGTAGLFALAIIEKLQGVPAAAKIKEACLLS
jgi:4-methyl-5(b-hydroxyethyl)-thiazole monophosphate biosynthesis